MVRAGLGGHSWVALDNLSGSQPLVARYYLGVDGGGTNCRIRLANEDLETLADASGGRSNLQIEHGDPAYRSITEGTREVFAKAGIDFAETANTHACFGMAGGRLTSARVEFEQRAWPFANVKVYDDIDIARAGAHGGADGAVIIVGTGSAALAQVEGQRHQAGGWGFHIGDQMSGAILGRELVRYSVEAADGLVPASPLTEAVIEKLGGARSCPGRCQGAIHAARPRAGRIRLARPAVFRLFRQG
jgi:glucosamine kinase